MLVPPRSEDFPAGSADCPIDVMFANLGRGRHAGVRATTHLYRPATAHIELSSGWDHESELLVNRRDAVG
jgi:hypothetical protein